MTDTLLEALEHTRAGFEEELVWHRFIMDAYLSTGGFAGKVKQPPAGFWGRASEVYSTLDQHRPGVVDTYLDRYESEDAAKFQDRIDALEYHPYVETLTDLKVDYLLKEVFEPRNRPAEVEAWRGNIDGNGTTWDEVFDAHVRRTAVLGWFPLLIDAPPSERDADNNVIAMTRAQATALKRQPYPVPLFPANLVDYGEDALGQLTYAKIRTDSMRQETWDAKPEAVTIYTVWTPEEFIKYEVIEKDAREVDRGTNPFGMVPIVFYRHKAAPGDANRGVAMHGNVSQLARAHLNRLSEFNEHMRGQVFALLVLSEKSGEGTKLIGSKNALTIDPESRQPHAYLAPPASVAETFEKRLEAIVREMYRLARVEYTRTTGNVMTAEAHAFEFAQTSLALANFAGEIARAEEALDFVVGRYYGVSDEKLLASTVVPPTSFDLDNLLAEVKTTFDLIAGDIGPTATRLLKMKLITQALPKLDADTLAIIEGELDEADTQAQADEALAVEAEAARIEAEATASMEPAEALPPDDAMEPDAA